VRTATLIACLLLSGCESGITPECFEGSPLAVEVQIEPSLSAPDLPEFTCSADIHPGFCYTGVSSASIHVQVGDLFAVRAESWGIVGWWPWTGIDLERRRARLCAYHYTDLGDAGGCDPPMCAVAGTLRMSRVPASDQDVSGIAMTLEVMFADGAMLQGAFRTP
jgi:hypothetical protein